MKKKSLLLLILIGSFLLLFSTTSVKAETTDTPLTDADIAQVFPHKDNTEIIISYVLEDQKELVLKTTEKNVLDIDTLKKELGEDNVLPDSEKNETIVKLDSKNISFKLFVDNQKPFTLSVHKITGEEIFNYDVNDTNQTRDIIAPTDDDEDESGWVFSEMLKVSEGPILEHSDGSSTRPLLYFGDYNYAIQRMSVGDAFGIRGKSRIDSLTTPGTAVLYASKGSRIEDGAKGNGNHIYTDHYGDHQENDYDMLSVINMGIKEDPRGIEDRSIGSPRSYTSNNLYNYVVESDGKGVPGVSGPNKIGESYAMLDTPKFYYRTNPQTGFEEQKMVFHQKAFYAYKKGRNNPEITTTIKLSFNKVGRVQTKIAFKNTGKYAFGNFVGLSNHDLSLNKDNQEIRDNRGKGIGNYVKLRALGNQRGMYMQSGDNQVRTSYYLNHENGPAGWAGRSSSKSYLATKGFMHSPGLLELIGSSNERYYPWKVGKDDHTWSLLGGTKPTKFFNDDIPGYRSPYVAEKLYNAFSDHWDKGDLERKEVGGRLGVKENDYTWDAGLTMRTSPRDLLTGQTIKLEYESQIDVKGTTFNPVFELDLHGTTDNPQIISDKELQDRKGKLPITGTWYDFDSTDVTMYYSIDSEDPEDDQILFNRSQSQNDAFNGKLNDITKVNLSLKGLDPGMHTIRFYMVDKEGHRSQIQEHFLKISKPVTNEPQIDVTSPRATSKNPYKVYGESIDIKGTWSDKDSKKIKYISYQINNHDEKIIRENIPNPTPGKQNIGDIDGLDISCCNNFDKNKIVFTIVDQDGLVGTDSFYFQHVPGGLTLSAPEEIDFGTLAVSPTGGTPVKPTIKEGKIILGDYRQQDAPPMSVSLKMDKFYKEEEHHDDQGGGDDSLANIDIPDKPDTKIEIPKEALVHDIYWKNKLISGDELIIGQSAQKTGPQWEYKTNLTEDVLKNLKIRFRSGENGASSGKYVSHWTWQTVDSVQ